MKRFDIYSVKLDPTIGKEIKKIRPAVIVSPDDLNDEIDTVIIAPMTTKIRNWASRVSVNFANKNGQIILDQIRSVDKSRLKKKLGSLHQLEGTQSLAKLREIFS